jgi:uncharacterized RDD family membrane protein YckC
MFSPDKLTIETPEQTSIEFQLAGIGSRFLTLALDTLLQIAIGIVLVIIGITLAIVSGIYKNTWQWIVAIWVFFIFTLNFGYFALFEALWAGRTPGKKWTRLRVIKDDGRPISAYDAILRNLLRIVDALPAFYGIGITCALLSPQSKRLGDYAAATVVVHEREAEVVPMWQRASQPSLTAAPVAQPSPEELVLIEAFLARRYSIDEITRRRLAIQLVQRLRERLALPPQDNGDAEHLLETLAEQGRSTSARN